jgi:hypothetical protein
MSSGIRSDNWIDLGKCKWGAVTSAPALVSELEAKLEKYPNPTNATLGRMLFTRRSLHMKGYRKITPTEVKAHLKTKK